MGDAEMPVERQLVESGVDLRASLLKVGHHGSRSSSRPEFLRHVAPEWAVISCGRRNRYGHPNHEVLEQLEQEHVRTLSTDMDGASCFVLDGHAVEPDLTCAR